jgi:hypothetical protein
MRPRCPRYATAISTSVGSSRPSASPIAARIASGASARTAGTPIDAANAWTSIGDRDFDYLLEVAVADLSNARGRG